MNEIILKHQQRDQSLQINELMKQIGYCFVRGFDEDFPSMRFESHAETCSKCKAYYKSLKPLLAELPGYEWLKKIMADEMKNTTKVVKIETPKTRFELLEIE